MLRNAFTATSKESTKHKQSPQAPPARPTNSVKAQCVSHNADRPANKHVKHQGKKSGGGFLQPIRGYCRDRFDDPLLSTLSLAVCTYELPPLASCYSQRQRPIATKRDRRFRRRSCQCNDCRRSKSSLVNMTNAEDRKPGGRVLPRLEVL
jgi:hypothetical protein